MAKAAVAIASSNLNISTPMAPPALRDFSQPWLDLNDKSVLVTGGTGSFGKHFLKSVCDNYKPRRLIIFTGLVLQDQAGALVAVCKNGAIEDEFLTRLQ